MFLSIRQHPNLPGTRSRLLLLLGCVCVAYGAYASWQALRGHRDELTLGAGQSVTRRFHIAKYLAEEAADSGVKIDVVSSETSQEALDNWKEGNFDLAVLSSGVTLPHTENVRVVAGLNIEPLHIIVRRQLVQGEASWLELFRGQRINLGVPGTNDHQLGSELLRFLRMQPRTTTSTGDYEPILLGKDELVQLANRCINATSTDERERHLQELPEVILMVASLPSNVAQTLIDTGEYELLPLPYAQTFLMGQLKHHQAATGEVQRGYLEATTIPASTYLANNPLPAADCPTLGMRALLVARADVAKPTIKKLMKSMFEGEFARRIQPVSPREILTPYGIHPGALAYLDRNQPIVTEEWFDLAGSALSIFGAFSAGALTLYGFVRRKRIKRPEEYLEEIRKIDLLAAGLSRDHDATIAPEMLARQLDHRLVKLKEQLIQDYCDNRVQGEMVMMSILSMLADSRAQLHRPMTQEDAPSPQAMLEEVRKQPAKDVLRNLRPAA